MHAFALPATPLNRLWTALSWLAAAWICWEFGYYQQYKLTGNPGSVHVFTTLSAWLGTPGGEQPFRIFVSSLELLAGTLVMFPLTRMVGGGLALGLMSGAIFFHVVSPLGIDPFEDGGVLFTEAVITWGMALLVVFLHRREVFALLARLGILPAERARA
jgi:uncharacterized membrane protein YphA (DoxX/SURF4 family)